MSELRHVRWPDEDGLVAWNLERRVWEKVPAPTDPAQAELEDLSVGYEGRWHQHHAAYVHACADCRRERRIA